MRKPDRYTTWGGINVEFQPTEWTRLYELVDDKKALFQELHRRYWKPIYAFLREMGYDNETAKDLTQEFFKERVWRKDFFSKADKNKGKLRNYFRKATKNYAIDLKRAAKLKPEIDITVIQEPESNNSIDEFDKAWGKDLLNDTLRELEAECRIRDKLLHWKVFYRWFLGQKEGRKRAMKEICSDLGISKVDQAYNMIANLKDRFRDMLRGQLRQQGVLESEMDEEIQYFIDLIAKISARK